MASTCACASVSASAAALAAAGAAQAPTVSRGGAAVAVSRVSFSSPLSLRTPSTSAFHGKALPIAISRTSGFRSSPSLRVRAAVEETTTTTTSEEGSASSEQLDQFVKDLQAKWEATENKQTVALYAGGAVVALWLSSTVVSAVNAVPLLPKVLELVGLGYTSWFVYRYLLFKESREELGEVIEELKGKITGTSAVSEPEPEE